jgi:hypothetical protein
MSQTLLGCATIKPSDLELDVLAATSAHVSVVLTALADLICVLLWGVVAGSGKHAVVVIQIS